MLCTGMVVVCCRASLSVFLCTPNRLYLHVSVMFVADVGHRIDMRDGSLKSGCGGAVWL